MTGEEGSEWAESFKLQAGCGDRFDCHLKGSQTPCGDYVRQPFNFRNPGELWVQPVIEHAEDILQALQATPDFVALLGEYEFKDQTTAPAMAILAGNENVEGVLEVHGLEVVIGRIPTTTSKPDITGCFSQAKTWKVYLIQYEDAAPNAAVDAADILVAMAPGASYSNVGGGYSEIAGVDQVVVTLPPHVTL